MSASSSRHFRPDIQGLRAVAVVLVILDHVFGLPVGGFVGVDVFFVISGFLITGLLLREFQRTGRISFRGFYARRARRILPAAAVVLVATVVASAALVGGSFARSVRLDALASAFAVGNWRFASTGTDYFARSATPSPLQHFWSLGVEEQFYFMWPWLLLGLLLLGRRLSSPQQRPTTLPAAGLAAVGVVSFIWAVLQTSADPTVAYFSSLTRSWELAVGAGLALAAPTLARLGRTARVVASGLGAVGLVASVLLVTPGGAFPGPNAALPVLSTALLIVSSGEGISAVLTLRPFTYLGDISYSLYLWHFPVLVFGQHLLGQNKRADAVICAIALLLAVLSFHLIERPAQSSPLLRRVSMSRTAWRSWWGTIRPGQPLRGLVGATVCTLLAVGSVVVAQPILQAQAAGQVDGAIPIVQAVQKPGTPAAQLEQGLIRAVYAQAWPHLNPSAADAPSAGAPSYFDARCSATRVMDPTSCTFGNPSGPELDVYGDSLGITLLPTVVAAYGRDYKIRGLTLAGCSVTDANVHFDTPAHRDVCVNFRRDAANYIASARPRVVLMIGNSAWGDNLVSKATGAARTKEWRAGATITAERFLPYVGKVAFVSPSPSEPAGIADCATPVNTPRACLWGVPSVWSELSSAESTVPGTSYVSTLHWYCVQDACPSFSGTTPLKRDFVHPTIQYAQVVVPDFRQMTAALVR